MGLDSLDLLVVPWPSETRGHRALSDRGERQRDGDLFLKTWKALQRLVDAGTVRALGGSERGFLFLFNFPILYIVLCRDHLLVVLSIAFCVDVAGSF